MSKTLKLRGAARYSVLKVSKDPVLRNDTIEVDDETAEKLLAERVRDRANTWWPVWEDVTQESASVDAEVLEEASEEEAPKPRRKRRAKRPAADSAA